MGFRKDFVWGSATSSYQIEGAAFEDGKGASVWDDFCRIPGKVFDGHTGDTACDHYHNYKYDVRLMAELGHQAYRFSISWPRVMPEGTGQVNEKGLEFYDNLVNELIKNGITPYITLFHWDYPSALMRRGGWMNPDSVRWFADYVEVVVKRLGDRVKNFITFNEPQCFLGSAFGGGSDAPGWKMHEQYTIPMTHHMMLAHGHAVKVIRGLVPDASVGYAPTGSGDYPLTSSQADIDAAREYTFAVANTGWGWSKSWFSDPVIFGKYPADGLEMYEKFLPKGWEKEMADMSPKLDFYAQNTYNGAPIRVGKDGKPERAPRVDGYDRTPFGWPVTPDSLYWGPKFLYERYKMPFYITENGLGCADIVSLDGKVHDPNRIDFTHRYLLAYRKAAEEGMDIRGYFHWSFMDNFEWCGGYSTRFGLVHVDYQTQKRTPKDSAYWYRDVIKSNGDNL